ncbi:HAD domain-containing protein [Frisingicoccus sp.]
MKYSESRELEVQKYLEEHPVNRFVILDDEDWGWAKYGYSSHWVCPSRF